MVDDREQLGYWGENVGCKHLKSEVGLERPIGAMQVLHGTVEVDIVVGVVHDPVYNHNASGSDFSIIQILELAEREASLAVLPSLLVKGEHEAALSIWGLCDVPRLCVLQIEGRDLDLFLTGGGGRFDKQVICDLCVLKIDSIVSEMLDSLVCYGVPH